MWALGCEPIVIAMDANSNVYSGKNCIGSLTHLSDLKTKMKEVVEARGARMADARGRDLNLKIPLPLH